jgi:hypothetical protein
MSETMKEKTKKSFSVALALTNAWQWKLQRHGQAAHMPMIVDGQQRIGTIQNYGLAWGFFGVTVSLNTIAPLPAIQIVKGPQVQLVDPRGQVLGGSNGQH